jgi:FixJ family two-component response regulator
MVTDEVVYLIDDDYGIRQSISALLESADVGVVAFESAGMFLERARIDQAACLLLDLELPGLSGLELQSRLAHDDSPPVIFISGRSDVPSTIRAMKAGAMEFLLKPVSSEVLLTAVHSAIARNREIRGERNELTQLRQRYSSLSQREREVLPLVVSGLMNKESASLLGIAEVTLQVHRRQILAKMGADSLADLVRMATRLDIPITSRAVMRAVRR